MSVRCSSPKDSTRLDASIQIPVQFKNCEGQNEGAFEHKEEEGKEEEMMRMRNVCLNLTLEKEVAGTGSVRAGRGQGWLAAKSEHESALASVIIHYHQQQQHQNNNNQSIDQSFIQMNS